MLSHSSGERLNLTSFPNPVALHVERGSTADVGFSCTGRLICNLMLDSGCSARDRGSMLFVELF
jgi:hypothetical protein